jgi:hypothetical protein
MTSTNRRWTKEEDAILTETVQTHGKQWGLIAGHLQQRTASQVAARWEKCLDPAIHKGPFTPDEDQLIINFVAQNGPRTWPQITSILPHRSAKQCRERWFNHLDPSVVKTEWTAQEDKFIFQQVEQHGPKWSVIAKTFPGRSDNAIKNRWNSSVSKRIQLDEQGRKFLLPDSAKRKYKPRERQFVPIPITADQERAHSQPPPPPPEKHTKPPRLEIPLLPPSSNVSPTISFTPFSLPTPVFPGTDGPLFSPNSPMGAIGGFASPTRTLPFFLSPTKSASEESFN